MTRSKAFIAAPLIGAIVFLTAIVFVVNINKAETNAVSQTAQEAYHNRISSIVELYRADAGSLFRESMKTVIEDALTSQCWSSLFTVTVGVDGAVTAEAKRTALKQARFQTCQKIKDTVHTIVCSNTGSSSDNRCADACLGSPDEEACLNRCEASGRSYGLQRWLTILNQEYSFEGIELSPSNKDSFERFFNPRENGDLDWVTYIRNCQALIPELAIDCAAFAEGELQCCKKDSGTEKCAAQDVIPGCDSGIFYVKIKPSDPTVYASLPRVQARDDAGNYIRAGALSDAGEFFLPISFPLFRYLDKAHEVFTGLAFSEHIGREEGRDEIEGILDSPCYGGVEECSNANPRMVPAGEIIARGSSDDAKAELARQYYEKVFLPAFSKALASSDLDVEFLRSGGAETSARCSSTARGFECEGENAVYVRDTLIKQNVQTVQNARREYSPYLPRLYALINLVDKDPRFRVKSGADNRFCWAADLRYKRLG